MAKELPKTYQPKEVEAKSKEIWKKGDYFHTEPPKKGGTNANPYTVVIPPTERNGYAAHGTRFEQHSSGYSNPL